MKIVLTCLIFSFVIATCHGFDSWITRKDPDYFIVNSRLLWYYQCICPAGVPSNITKEIALNTKGYGRKDIPNSHNCNCRRYNTPPGSEIACIGCSSGFPNVGANRFNFFHTCYCNGGCTAKQFTDAALNGMMKLSGQEQEVFIYRCNVNGKTDYCLCEAYSAQVGSPLLGCTPNNGWYFCPESIKDYKTLYKQQVDDFDTTNPALYDGPEMKPEIFIW